MNKNQEKQLIDLVRRFSTERIVRSDSDSGDDGNEADSNKAVLGPGKLLALTILAISLVCLLILF